MRPATVVVAGRRYGRNLSGRRWILEDIGGNDASLGAAGTGADEGGGGVLLLLRLAGAHVLPELPRLRLGCQAIEYQLPPAVYTPDWTAWNGTIVEANGY